MLQTLIKKIGLILFICLITLAAYRLYYLYDNKYTASAPVSSDGQVILDTNFLAEGKVTCLSEGWFIYPNTLLSPNSSVSESLQPFPLRIGQYLTFSDMNPDHSPYGTATYILNLSGDSGVYSMLLPEVYSACKVYADGRLLASSGSLSPYSSNIRDLVVSFPLEGNAQIIVQTANYSHYYSGLTYPPVLGSPESIHRYSSLRMIFYGFLCFTALTTALFSSAVWITAKKSGKNRLPIFFAGLALSFSIRISYPFFHLIALPADRILYALEDCFSLFGIWCTGQIIITAGGFLRNHLTRILSRFSLGMAVVGIIIPLFILPLLPAFTIVYGPLISWYKLFAALLFVFFSLYGTIRHGAVWAISGTVVYAVSLLFSVLAIGRMEPLYTAWPDEYGAYALVLCFAGLMVAENRTLVLDNIRLTYHLQEEVDQKTRQLSCLVNERQKLLSEFLHDIKSPVSSMAAYTSLIRSDDLFLDESTRAVLDSIEAKSLDVTSQIRAMQEFAVENPILSELRDIDLSALLRAFYQSSKPDADARGVYLKLSPLPEACQIRGDKGKLIRALQNLFYNALDFTPEDGEIRISLHLEKDEAVLTVEDTGCGISPDCLSHVFDRLYTSRSDDGGTGLGLYLVYITAQEHGGSVTVSSRLEKGSTFSMRLPRLM